MAALQLKEEATTGRLILQAAPLSRLGSIVFGLIWLVGTSVFLLPIIFDKKIDWVALVFIFLFAVIPAGTSLLGAVFTTTVTIDRTSRTVSSAKSLLFLPVSSTTLLFNDLRKIELQYVSRSEGTSVWLVNAVSRDGKRVALNWNGTQGEMAALAQKVSTVTGVPVSETAYTLPVALEQMLGKIAPDVFKKGAQADTQAPAPRPSLPSMPDPYAPPPVAAPWAMPPNELSQTQEPTIPSAVPVPESEPAPAKDVWNLPIGELERRVASDTMDSDARYALARKYHARGQTDRAIGLYRQALRIDPTNTNGQNDLGVALQASGKRADAETAYRRAVALDPFSFTAHLNLALLLRAMNRAAEASQEFYLARQNARTREETRVAEDASTGARVGSQLSKT